jgi:hypothetical protein
MQFREGLSDRGAAEAVRTRIDWKYLLSLDLDDAGFDHSVLCEFRQRLLDCGGKAALAGQEGARSGVIYGCSTSRKLQLKATTPQYPGVPNENFMCFADNCHGSWYCAAATSRQLKTLATIKWFG